MVLRHAENLNVAKDLTNVSLSELRRYFSQSDYASFTLNSLHASLCVYKVHFVCNLNAKNDHLCFYTPTMKCRWYTGIAMAVRPSVRGHNFVRRFSPTVLHVLV